MIGELVDKHPRELNSYSSHMNVSLKEAHFMYWCVKGHLIPDEWSNDDIIIMYDSYFKRLWGNNERVSYCYESFEKAWIIKIDAGVAGK